MFSSYFEPKTLKFKNQNHVIYIKEGVGLSIGDKRGNRMSIYGSFISLSGIKSIFKAMKLK